MFSRTLTLLTTSILFLGASAAPAASPEPILPILGDILPSGGISHYQCTVGSLACCESYSDYETEVKDKPLGKLLSSLGVDAVTGLIGLNCHAGGGLLGLGTQWFVCVARARSPCFLTWSSLLVSLKLLAAKSLIMVCLSWILRIRLS